MKYVPDATEDRIAYALARNARAERWYVRTILAVLLAAAIVLAL